MAELNTFQIKSIESDVKGLNGESEKRRPFTESCVIYSHITSLRRAVIHSSYLESQM